MSDLLKGVNLFLIGMMGCGKTTVGQHLAKQLNYRFFDTDAVIERVIEQAIGQPMSIAQFFAESGEPAFRNLESQVLAQLAGETRSVIATGGGIVLKQENWSYLHHGVVVWLEVPVEQLQQRLAGDTTRPLLQTADPVAALRSLLAAREALYAQADVRVACEASTTPEQVADTVIVQIQKILRSDSSKSDSFKKNGAP